MLQYSFEYPHVTDTQLHIEWGTYPSIQNYTEH